MRARALSLSLFADAVMERCSLQIIHLHFFHLRMEALRLAVGNKEVGYVNHSKVQLLDSR